MHAQLLVSYFFDIHGLTEESPSLKNTYFHHFFSEEGFISKLKACVVQLSKIQHGCLILQDLDQQVDTIKIKMMLQIKSPKLDIFLVKALKKLLPTAEKFLLTLKPDENLLFFLLNHHEQCANTFGKDFLWKFFKNAHPKGLKQTERFLIQQFQKRGFAYLNPIVRKKMADFAL
jgi:hypothetical protein